MISRVWEHGATKLFTLVVLTCIVLAGAYALLCLLPFGRIAFSLQEDNAVPLIASSTPERMVVVHKQTPLAVKAIYMTGCIASEKRLRDKVLAVIRGTEINSIVVDYKDYTGTISYASTTLQDPQLAGKGCRITDLPEFIAELHGLGLYTIGRITTFQDPLYASQHIDVAIQSKSHPGMTWKDTHGLAYIYPGARAYWDYVIAMGREAYDIGFDEINFDYIRFPSDGVLSDMLIPHTASSTKASILKQFFIYLHDNLDPSPVTQGTSTTVRSNTHIVTSADLFGLTTSALDDMGIGQILENTFPYFDYVAPMVYPSHFAKGFNGFAEPAKHPYEVVLSSMSRAVERVVTASTSPLKLRTWIQAFDLGTVYTPDMVRAQMKATYDSGLTSWMIWNAASVYKKDYLLGAGSSSTSTTIRK